MGAGQVTLPEGVGLVLPLRGEPGDRRRREPRPRTQEPLQRRTELAGRKTMQIQQRLHLRQSAVWGNERSARIPALLVVR
jgi:hypothetical protein